VALGPVKRFLRCLGNITTTGRTKIILQTAAEVTPIGLLILADGMEAFKSKVKESGFTIFPAYSRPPGTLDLIATPNGDTTYMQLVDPNVDNVPASSAIVGSCEEETNTIVRWQGHRCRFFD